MAALAANPKDGSADWASFCWTLVGTSCLVFALGVGFLLAVDPYDTGRTGLLGRSGLHDQYPFTANASRTRDARFDAAIFGNSHVQALRPERLDPQTGLAFANLSMPATYPADILDVLGWYFISHPGTPRAVVIGIDDRWCRPDEKRNDAYFPTWLYARGFLPYLGGLVRSESFEAARLRLSFLRGAEKELRPDGYWYYGPLYDKLGLTAREPSYRKLAETVPFPKNDSRTYPGIARLRRELAHAPAETVVLLLRMPVYRTALPAPRSEDGQAATSCGAQVASVAADRPRTLFLDLLAPGPDADDPDNFYNHSHVRDRFAIGIETSVANALKSAPFPLGAPKS